jgi:SAM-dependent methyltransferase
VNTDLKACCAAAYSSGAARLVLGDSLHPGGAALTSRLAAALGVGPGQVVLDVASGLGTSARQVADETGCDVVGVELSAENVAEAERRGDGRVRFLQGDAENLPFDDESFDGALCECSFCLFPDADEAAAEVARVLRPGGRLALSDVITEPERLPSELRTVLAEVACIAKARPLEELVWVFEEAGLEAELTERHDGALAEFVGRIDARLRSLGVGDVPLVATARSAIEDGALGYGVVVARRP